MYRSSVFFLVLFWIPLATAAQKPRVLVLGSEPDRDPIAHVAQSIRATGLFRRVDTENAHRKVVKSLAPYDAVLAWLNSRPKQGSQSYGNLLAEHILGGGGLVVASFSDTSQETLIDGRYYRRRLYTYKCPVDIGPSHKNLQLGTKTAHPIMAAINSLNGGLSSFFCVGDIVVHPKTKFIARWSNGRPLVGIRSDQRGRIVGLNLYPVSDAKMAGSWIDSTDGAKLIANALSWAAGKNPAKPASTPTKKKRPDYDVEF